MHILKWSTIRLKTSSVQIVTISVVQMSDLQKHIARCTGEMKCSSGEYRVMQVLENMRIEYQYNTSHEVKSTSYYSGILW
jgi:hypothetical protein